MRQRALMSLLCCAGLAAFGAACDGGGSTGNTDSSITKDNGSDENGNDTAPDAGDDTTSDTGDDTGPDPDVNADTTSDADAPGPDVDPDTSGGCTGNDECPPNQYCAADTCGGAGTCTAVPGGCPDVYMPVCGCDGSTYGNACEAATAGVNVAAPGECGSAGDCTTNGDCDPGEYCAKVSCNAATGTCTPNLFDCAQIYDPVCGCDGNTYGNACSAASSGVNVAYEGECTPTCDGVAIACPNGQIPVDTDGDGCDDACACYDGNVPPAGGDCPPPDGDAALCIETNGIWDPFSCGPYLCGAPPFCDAIIPGCNCGANANWQPGVGCVPDDGCMPVVGDCGGFIGAACQPGNFCEYPTGQCNIADNIGSCTPIPQICPDIFAPVCGCDGTTYGNDCERQAEGVSKAHDGACNCEFAILCVLPLIPIDTNGDGCEDTCGCPDGSVPGPDGTCGGNNDKAALCVETGGVWDVTACGDYYCGIPNDCDAIIPGCDCGPGSNFVDGQGCVADPACNGGQFCGGIAGFQCPAGQWCDPEPGMCLVADGGGYCVELPGACIEIYDPVCGCDGKTYSNDCFRQAAQVGKDHDGECGGTNCPPAPLCGPAFEPIDTDGDGCPDTCAPINGGCGSNADCVDANGTANQYCAKDGCGPDAKGVCVPIPQICTDEVDPVCACDGNTYGNPCEAAAVGQSIDYKGPCATLPPNSGN